MSQSGQVGSVVCPVTGCNYSGPLKSVAAHVSGKKDPQHDWSALGYGGYYEYIRERKSSQDEKTVLVHMTDTHIGRETGGHFGSSWPIDCAQGFVAAIDVAISVGADAVVHTGDLFHNDTETGITEAHLKVVVDALGTLGEADIPFYYVLGDHEREAGKKVRARLTEFDLIESLSTTPTLIGDHVALYGVDYQTASWWDQNLVSPKAPPSGRHSILALHQSMRQFVKPDQAECDARVIQRQAQSSSDFRFDTILVGQHHKDIKTNIGGCEVLCGGATERISKRSFEPFVRQFTIDESGCSHQKEPLSI